MREFWMDTDILDAALDSCDLGDWHTARVRQFPHTSYRHLYTKVREVDPNSDAEKDYQDMRKFQIKFIEADHKLRALEAVYEECEKALEKAKMRLAHRRDCYSVETDDQCVCGGSKFIEQTLTSLRKAHGK